MTGVQTCALPISGILTGEKLATLLCHGNWLYFPSITWKTDTIKRYSFDTKYKILEDVIIELTMIIMALRFISTQQKLFNTAVLPSRYPVRKKVKMVSDSRKRKKSMITFPIGLMRLAGKKPHEQQNFA